MTANSAVDVAHGSIASDRRPPKTALCLQCPDSGRVAECREVPEADRSASCRSADTWCIGPVDCRLAAAAAFTARGFETSVAVAFGAIVGPAQVGARVTVSDSRLAISRRARFPERRR
jgi:hypothetical protein